MIKQSYHPNGIWRWNPLQISNERGHFLRKWIERPNSNEINYSLMYMIYEKVNNTLNIHAFAFSMRQMSKHFNVDRYRLWWHVKYYLYIAAFFDHWMKQHGLYSQNNIWNFYVLRLFIREVICSEGKRH